MSKKKSPRSIPRTQQDVERAYEKGHNQGFQEGIKGGLTIMLYCMRDKFGATDEELAEFSRAFNYTAESIEKDYVKASDLMTVVKEEYGTVLHLQM